MRALWKEACFVLALCLAMPVLWSGMQGCGVKIECRDIDQCKPPARFCAAGLCRECNASTDCLSTPTRPVCDLKTWRCVAFDGGAPDLSGPCSPPGTRRSCYASPLPPTRRPCRQGTQSCQSNGTWGPCEGQVLPQKEICDGVDNDCNGKVDDTLEQCERCVSGLTRPCYTGKEGTEKNRPCRQGTQRCVGSTWAACSGEVLPKKEECDQVDNDCNGKIDDGLDCGECVPGRSDTCTPDNPLCAPGLRTCGANRKWGTCVARGRGSAEKCNGLDDDCDGKIDDNVTDKPPPCPKQLGVCSGSLPTCKDGKWETCDEALYKKHDAAYSSTEGSTCDGKDNNCDGEIDEGLKGCVFTLSGGARGTTNGPASQALYGTPRGLWIAPNQDIYLTENIYNRIRKIDVKLEVAAFSGSTTAGMRNGSSTSTRFRGPTDILYSDARKLFVVADQGNHILRFVSTVGSSTHGAGRASTISQAGYANGSATASRFNKPTALAVDATGNIYIADAGNHAIRMLSPQGAVTTLAGTCSTTRCTGGFADGAADAAKFNQPSGLAYDPKGFLYVSDAGNFCIRQIDLAKMTVSTFAGTCTKSGFADGPAASALFQGPRGLALSNGELYVADFAGFRIRKIAAGMVSTVAGIGTAGVVDGPISKASLSGPWGLAFDPKGVLYFTDTSTTQHRIRGLRLK